MRHYPRRVENYTTPFLVSFGVFLFSSFLTLAVLVGFPTALLVAAIIWIAINLLDHHRNTRSD